MANYGSERGWFIMKLIPLKQWYCDTCGKIIEKPEDGYVQFHYNEDHVYDDFIIVHHAPESPLRKHGRDCYKYHSDCELKSFLGTHGLVEVLALLDPGPYHTPKFKERVINVRKWADFVRRLQLPYFEEARIYWERASADGYFGDSNEIYIYVPDKLKSMIEHYEKLSE